MSRFRGDGDRLKLIRVVERRLENLNERWSLDPPLMLVVAGYEVHNTYEVRQGKTGEMLYDFIMEGERDSGRGWAGVAADRMARELEFVLDLDDSTDPGE